jgi:hypothetical protein
MKIVRKCFVVLVVALAFSDVIFAQSAKPAETKQPSFSIVISMPPVVRAESELLLEIAMMNTSSKDINYGIVAGWPAWQMFQIDLRDAAGRPVLETPAGQRISNGPRSASSVFAVPLAPGKAWRPQMILNRVYDLSQPGEYMVQARRTDSKVGVEVKSNLLTFRIPPVPIRHLDKPAISIAISTPFDLVKVGWQMPIEISVKNLSDQSTLLAVWNGQNRDSTSKEPDEFGFGLEVRDSKGGRVSLTKQGQALLHRDELPNGYFEFVPIPPRETVTETRVVGGIYDIAHAGKYLLQVVLTDPTTNLPVKSNTVTAAVNDSAEFHPSFIINISPEESFTKTDQFGLRICQTNISDHVIKLDNATFNREISLRDGQGALVPLSAEGKKRMVEEREKFDRGDRGTDASHLWNLGPRENLCGVITLDASDKFWEPRKPGKYSIQIVRFDYPDKTAGQELEDLQIVKSNTITWTVPAESSVAPKAAVASSNW